MKFRKKPEVVEAVQWNGENLAEVREFLGVQLIYTTPFDNAIPLSTIVGKMHAAVGDWMVKAENGAVMVFEPANMLKLFETYDFEFEGQCGCCGFKDVPVKYMTDEKAYVCNVCLVGKTPQQRAEQYMENLNPSSLPSPAGCEGANESGKRI